MAEETPFHLTGDDGARYSFDVIRDRSDEEHLHYDLDLVRSLNGRFGESIEQRLTLAEFEERQAALAEQREMERTLLELGLAGMGDVVERVRHEPVLYDGQYRFATDPSDAQSSERAGLNLFSSAEETSPTEREIWVQRGVEVDGLARYGEPGSLDLTQPPDPDQPGTDAPQVTAAQYAFGYGIGPSNAPSLEAVKTWVDGGERRFDRFTIAEYGQWEEARADERALEATLQAQGLEAALNQAERMAVAGGYLDPDRPDGRVFLADDAPPDPFITERQRTLSGDSLSYFFDYNRFGDDGLTLEAYKTWSEVDGTRQSDSVVLDYREGDSGGPALAHLAAEAERLTALQQTAGLETAMNEAERMAAMQGLIDDERADSRLFTHGPPDPFTTQRQQERSDEIAREPEYRVDAISADGFSRLEAVKTWGDAADQEQRLLIPQPDWETARQWADTAHRMLERGDVQGAMMLVEVSAIEAGVIDPQRDDPRLFTAGPPDPFITLRQLEINASPSITEMDTQPDRPVTAELAPADNATFSPNFAAAAREREANAALAGAAWFEATFEPAPTELLQPVHDSVNYAVVVQGVDPWTTELAVEKYWKAPGSYLGSASQTLTTFDAEDDPARQAAESERQELIATHDTRGLEAMMHQAELAAIRAGWLDAERSDPRLFTQGPPDRFETLAQQLESEINPYWNTAGEQIEDPTPEARVEYPYWRLDPIPVSEPNGEPLGQALHMVVYPAVERNPDAVGSPTMATDEPFKLLEMAHFETSEAVDKFSKEFNSFLVPGLLDGPELALEVARLEGLPVEWKTLEGDELKAYQNAEMTLTRDPADWHPYNPNAERDARVAAEGLYTDPTQQIIEGDGPEIASSASELDF